MGTGAINNQLLYWEAGSPRDDGAPVLTSVHAPEQSIGHPRIDYAGVPAVNRDGIRRNSGSGEPQINRCPAPPAVRAFEDPTVLRSRLERLGSFRINSRDSNIPAFGTDAGPRD